MCGEGIRSHGEYDPVALIEMEQRAYSEMEAAGRETPGFCRRTKPSSEMDILFAGNPIRESGKRLEIRPQELDLADFRAVQYRAESDLAETQGKGSQAERKSDPENGISP